MSDSERGGITKGCIIREDELVEERGFMCKSFPSLTTSEDEPLSGYNDIFFN